MYEGTETIRELGLQHITAPPDHSHHHLSDPCRCSRELVRSPDYHGVSIRHSTVAIVTCEDDQFGRGRPTIRETDVLSFLTTNGLLSHSRETFLRRDAGFSQILIGKP